jgi:RNA polymerase nonessential primary-like sigma factor
MEVALPDPPPLEALLALALDCFSAALRGDYLSSGVGHRQTRVPTRRSAARARVPASEDGVEVGEADDPGLADVRPVETDSRRLYLRELSRIDRLTSAEEYQLAVHARQGDERAARQLVEHNLGLVVMLARRYANVGSVPQADLIAEGNLGLLAAVSRFDPELGFRFSTYAKWWVRQAIDSALVTQFGVVRLPVRVARSLRQGQRKSADDEPAARADIVDGGALVHDMRDFDTAATSDDDASLLSRLPAPPEEAPDHRLQSRKRRDRLHGLLARLDANERRVIQNRFGLDGEEPQTLQTLALQLRLSGERVRQIEREALVKLRRECERNGLDADALI